MYTPTATTILYQFCIRFHGSQYIYVYDHEIIVMLHGRSIELALFPGLSHFYQSNNGTLATAHLHIAVLFRAFGQLCVLLIIKALTEEELRLNAYN